jgi:O-antigen ligase
LTSRWRGVPGLPWLLLSGVVVFQHRTVWVTMGVSLIAMWTVLGPSRDQRRSQFSRRLSGVAVAVGIVVLLIAGGKLGTLQSDLARSTESATGEHSTFEWRLEGWRYLLKQQQADSKDLVLGIPYGSGYKRVLNGVAINVSPHSWYVQTITRVGIVGTCILLIALAGLLRRGRPAGLLPRNLGALLVLSAMLFGIAYQPTETQGILLGVVALSWCGRTNSPSVREDESGSSYRSMASALVAGGS